MENIWSILKNEIKKVRTKTVSEFENCIQKQWDKINLTMIRNIIDSMPNRIRLLIENKGDQMMVHIIQYFQ